MKVWAVCGAGRGVGKTHLSLALSELLEVAVYAKRGHSPRKPGKPPNYFRSEEDLESFVEGCRGRYQNVVLESNAWARSGRSDLVIYVEGPRRLADARRDREHLRRIAQIVVDPRGMKPDWQDELASVVLEAERRRAVASLLEEQAAYLRYGLPRRHA